MLDLKWASEYCLWGKTVLTAVKRARRDEVVEPMRHRESLPGSMTLRTPLPGREFPRASASSCHWHARRSRQSRLQVEAAHSRRTALDGSCEVLLVGVR